MALFGLPRCGVCVFLALWLRRSLKTAWIFPGTRGPVGTKTGQAGAKTPRRPNGCWWPEHPLRWQWRRSRWDAVR